MYLKQSPWASHSGRPRPIGHHRLRGITATLSSLFVVGSTLAANAIPSVWTEHNDNGRTGQNLSETVLTPANVNSTQFGALFHYNLDDESYSQPLYLPGLTMSVDNAAHNVVFVTSVAGSVYAFDADSATANGGNPLWHVNLTPAGSRVPNRADFAAMGACGGGYVDFSGNMGIVGTPVIDTSTNTMYVICRDVTGGVYRQRLHALDCKSGAEKFAGPVDISGSNAGTNFDPALNNQRTALALANGIVYAGWSSQCDFGGYHGYIIGFNATNLNRVAAWSSTNSGGGQAGIWQGGQAPAVDGSNNLYFMTGNGTWDGAGNYGESAVKLAGSSLTFQDYFTPNNYASLNGADDDLGSAGLLLIPGTSYVFGGGKRGMVYLMNTAGMGHENGTDQVVQEFQATFPAGGNSGHIHGGPVYFNTGSAQYVYLWGENDFCRAYQFNGTSFTTSASGASTMRAPVTNSGMPGGFLTVSANGGSNGIIWALTPWNANANNAVVAGVLHAFNAVPSGGALTELWNSQQNAARDNFGNFAKFTYPTVANGKVYLSTFGTATSGSGTLWIYGQITASGGPVKIDAAGPANGAYVADTDFSGGTVATAVTNAIDTSAVLNPAPQGVYQTERYGNPFSYTVPGLTAGATYTVRLHMCENYQTATGLRSFSATVNGVSAFTNLDLFAAAGGQFKAICKQVTTTANSSGQIVINFTSTIDNALIDGIEVNAGAPPAAPTGLTPTAGNAQIALSWGTVSGATNYAVYRGTAAGGEALIPVASGLTGTSYTNTGLTNGTRYYYTVVAYNATGQSSASAEVNAVPAAAGCAAAPSAPTGLAASSTTSTGTTLSWTAVTPPANCSISNYTVYKNGASIGTATSTSMVVTGLSPSTTYSFTVAASDSVGTGGQSSSINVTTAASGGGIQIACGNSAVAPFVADTDFSGGAVSSGTTTTINTSKVTNPAPMSVWQHGRKSTCTYTIPGLTVGATYTVRLDFCEYAATGTGQRTFNVSINGTQVLTNFDIFAAAGGEFIANQQTFTTTANSSGQVVIVFTTVLNNVLVAGIEVSPGGASCSAAPSAPAGLAASGTTSTSTNLNWNAVTPPANCSITGYKVYKNGTLLASPTTNSYAVTGLTASTTYSFTVAAVDSVGTGSQSSTVNVTTSSASCAAAPGAPTGLAASGTTSTGTTLNWTAVTPPANCSITGYTIYKAGVSIGTSTSTSFAVTGLTASTTYSFTVAATDSFGTGGQSSAVNVTTSASGGACTGIAAWNGNSVPYAVGNLVTYQGNEYKCITAHTSLSTWDPVDAASLWQLVGPC